MRPDLIIRAIACTGLAGATIIYVCLGFIVAEALYSLGLIGG